MKFSTSPRRFGYSSEIIVNIKIIKINPKRSLKEKYGWNEILSVFELIPRGLFDPVWWRNNKWIIIKAATMKGKRKWMEKNRVSVALSTANPPHTHCTKKLPR